MIRPDAAVPALRPSVSALLVTRRPGLAVSVLRAIEHQTYPELEVVVAVHGVPQDPALEQTIAASERPVELVMVPAEATFGEALAIATGRARGGLLIKFDDDDIYGPEHVWDLVVGRAISGASVVGKAAQFVWLEQQGTTIRRGRPTADVYGKVVAGGTILVARGELEDLGPLVREMLKGSQEKRHQALREDIRRFLRSPEASRSDSGGSPDGD